MQEPRRARRRRDQQRVLAKTYYIIRRVWGEREPESWVDWKAHRMAENRKLCGHWCCQNLRRLEGPTIQERRQM